jgi:Beta propeller domain
MKRTKILPPLLAASLLFAACSNDSPDARTGPTGTDADDAATNTTATTLDETERRDDPRRSAKAALRQFDECGAFLDYVHTEGAERVGAYGFNDSGWYGGGPIPVDVAEASNRDFEAEGAPTAAVEETDSAASAPTGGDDGTGQSTTGGGEPDGSFSTTNVQVEGVDEPDIVKTDGQRVMAVTDGELHYVDVDGGSGTKRGSISLVDGLDQKYGYGQEILVSGNRAFVIAQSDTGGFGPVEQPAVIEDEAPPATTRVSDDGDAEADFAVEPSVDPILIDPIPGGRPYVARPTTIVIEIDLTNPDQMTIVNTLTLDGRYISARAIGDTARIAVTTPAQDLGFLYPSSPNAEDAAIEANRDLVRNTTIEDWMPTYELVDAAGNVSPGDLVSCDRINAPEEFAGFDMLSVVTLPLGQSLTAPAQTTSVMATGDTVYASQDRLYVSTNAWLPPTLDDQQRGEWEDTYQTNIHRFSLPVGDGAVYEASGTVDGHLLNQFSMNDRDGTFFVATTTGAPWSSDGSESQIVSMQVNGDVLEQVGQVGGLGKGEQIFSVRYANDVAYVVTFRQTDPFYVVDLASPTNMAVLGELKIPGFSSYLHPISDTLVLGVGQDATADGGQTGSKVSLFDVSDRSNPREVDVWTLPTSSSTAEFDHRAFLWWAETSTAVLPLTSWSDQFSGAVVLNVTADGITEQGRVTHVDETNEQPGVTDCEVFDGSGLTEADGELFWITQDPSSRLQLCGPDDQGGATGYSCDVIPVDEIENWFSVGDDQGGTGALDLTGVDHLEWCWVDGGVDWQKQIQRTLVIDASVWSMSNGRLQANDLTTLERTAAVDL